MNRFKKYIHTNSLKKVDLTFIVIRIKDNEMANLRETFTAFDSNKGGLITFAELKEGLAKLNIDCSAIKDIFDLMDTDKSGRIDDTEFIEATFD